MTTSVSTPFEHIGMTFTKDSVAGLDLNKSERKRTYLEFADMTQEEQLVDLKKAVDSLFPWMESLERKVNRLPDPPLDWPPEESGDDNDSDGLGEWSPFHHQSKAECPGGSGKCPDGDSIKETVSAVSHKVLEGLKNHPPPQETIVTGGPGAGTGGAGAGKMHLAPKLHVSLTEDWSNNDGQNKEEIDEEEEEDDVALEEESELEFESESEEESEGDVSEYQDEDEEDDESDGEDFKEDQDDNDDDNDETSYDSMGDFIVNDSDEEE